MLRCNVYSSADFYADVLQEEEGDMQPGLKPDARSTDKPQREEGGKCDHYYSIIYFHTLTQRSSGRL